MPSRDARKQRKTPSKSSSAKPAPVEAQQTIVVKIRAPPREPTSPEEMGSVWFRNHNPNAKPAATITPAAPGNAKAAPPPPPPAVSQVRSVGQYDSASVPPWARYRLPPTTPLPSALDECARSPASGMNGNATPFEGTAVPKVHPQLHQGPSLYPFTMDGLSIEMHDYVLSMQLTQQERDAREQLKSKIEKVVSMLWPSPSDSSSFSVHPRSSIPSPELSSSVASMGTQSRPVTPLPSSLEFEGDHPSRLSATVILFGSYALDVATPSSDLDLSVVFCHDYTTQRDAFQLGERAVSDADEEIKIQRSASKVSFEVLRLRELAEAIRAYDETIEVRVLEECRVPVAHVIDLPTGISADISINMPHMARVVEMQRAWLDEEEAMEGLDMASVSKVRSLILLSKLALRQWGMGCSYTGGLSSTGVYLLVERYLREGRLAGCVPSPLPPLARLVIDFWLYMSSDMFQQGFLASDVFHISNSKPLSVSSPSYVPSALSSPREVRSVTTEEIYSSAGVSPTALDAPHSFPSVATQGFIGRTTSNISPVLPDVTRRCTRMGEIQFLFRHSATALEQLVSSSPKNVWSLPLTPLSSVLADPRLTIPKQHAIRQHQLYRPTKAALTSETTTRSDRSSTPGASSNGSDVAESPSVQSNVSPVKFKSSLKNFVGAPCFVPRKLLATPPPSYDSLEN